MSASSLSHLADQDLTSKLKSLAAQERTLTAALLAHLGEFESRRLYAAAGFRSMHEYCLRELEFSDDVAYKRIDVARAARQFPILLDAIADGRLNLTAALVLVPRLEPDAAEELIEAAAHKTRFEIELLLASRFPKDDVPERLEPCSPPARTPASSSDEAAISVNESTTNFAPGRKKLSSPLPKVAPLAPERFSLQLAISKSAHDKLRELQDLLGYQVAARDLERVLEYALDAGIALAKKSKFAATDKPCSTPNRASKNPRHVPAHVKRAVYERDQGRCTFVNESGRRCTARKGLEFDHVTEVARGGVATVDNIRLRCRAHNQYTAERTFGAGFMDEKRRATVAARAQAGSPTEQDQPEAPGAADASDAWTKAAEVIRFLEKLDARPGLSRSP